MKRKRVLAVLVAVAVAFTVLFSVIFPSTQADHVHDESGETCAICATIQECNELLSSLSAAISVSEEYRAPRTHFIGESERRKRALSARRVTPVSLKVKLIS